jgi:hypothetical protein
MPPEGPYPYGPEPAHGNIRAYPARRETGPPGHCISILNIAAPAKQRYASKHLI